MKKLITTLIVCSFAVVIYLQNGNEIKADRIVRFLNKGVIVEIDSTNVQNRLTAKTRVFIPNSNIAGIEYN